MLGSTSMVQSINDNCTEMIIHKNLTPKSATQSGGSSGGNSGTESGGNSGGSGENGSTEPEDPCADFEPTICMTECTNNNGVAEYTYAEEGTPCHEIMIRKHARYGLNVQKHTPSLVTEKGFVFNVQ